jgi:hypothetical protein
MSSLSSLKVLKFASSPKFGDEKGLFNAKKMALKGISVTGNKGVTRVVTIAHEDQDIRGC